MLHAAAGDARRRNDLRPCRPFINLRYDASAVRPWKGPRVRRHVLIVVALLAAWSGTAAGQSGDFGRLLSEPEKAAVRAGQVGIIAGNPGGTYIQIARDMAVLLDTRSPAVSADPNQRPIRVVPIVGRGSACNIEDLLNLRGIDAAIVQHDVIAGMRRVPAYARIDGLIRYITTIYAEELHLLARDGVGRLQDLAGKAVAVGEACSGSELTASNLFMLAGVDARLVAMPNERALRALMRGEIAAIAAVGGKPMRLFREIARADAAGSGLRFVDLAPQAELLGGYEPARLTAQDYPALIAEGGSSETRAVRAVLAVYNWAPKDPRYASTATFVRALFTNIDRFKDSASGFSEKWREVDPDRDLIGWQRFGVTPATVGRETAADGVLVMRPACREAFHADLRRGGIEPSEMRLADYAARRTAFRSLPSSPCR